MSPEITSLREEHHQEAANLVRAHYEALRERVPLGSIPTECRHPVGPTQLPKGDLMATQAVGYKAKAFEPRNLAFFFLLAFGLSWVLNNAPQIFGLLNIPSGIESAGPVAILRTYGPVILLITVGAWGPTIAAFVMTAVSEGKLGVKALWRRFWNRNLSIQWLLVTLLILPALALVANLVARVLDGEAYPLLDLPNPAWILVPQFLGVLATGLSEEFGWRGYVLPRFQARWNALTSSIILGAIWAFWHLPMWLIPGDSHAHRNFWVWALGMILMSVLMTWIFNNTRGSVLSAVLLHAMTNTQIFWCFGSSEWTLRGVELLAVVLIVTFFGARNLVRQRPEEIAGQERVRAMGD
jgi:membrane protease YdiL (CAAX protease family)